MGGGSVGLFSGLWLSEVVGDMVVYEPVPTQDYHVVTYASRNAMRLRFFEPDLAVQLIVRIIGCMRAKAVYAPSLHQHE